MMEEIRTYLGVAMASEGNSQEYPVGERHAFNLFMSQEAGTEPNWELAESTILNECWCEIELRKTGVLSQKKATSSEEPFPAMYKHALENGSALLFYREPEP